MISTRLTAIPAALLCALALHAQSVDVPGSAQWTDSGIDVQAGDQLTIAATGKLHYPQSAESGPEGLPRSWKDLLRILPSPQASHGCLIARIGKDADSLPFLIGPSHEIRVGVAGRLYLGINQTLNETADGSFRVTVGRKAGASPPPGTSKTQTIAGVNGALLDKIPRRIGDNAGHAGDMVNFLIVGQEEEVTKVFETAGWVKVDRTKKDAVMHALMETLSKEAYLEMPMSELYLFGRVQDYGFAHAVPFQVVAQRHHLRIWKAPFQVNGQPLWVGAATHDTGFERDQRNNGITHKIDPDIDKERKFVGDSLNETGLLSQLTYILPANPLIDAKTATGEEFHSDGRVLAMSLAKTFNDQSAAFASVFCAVLAQKHPDDGAWDACGTYLEATASADRTLDALPAKYRLLIVPGVFGQCTSSSAPAFQQGQAYLKSAYGWTVELLPMPNDSTEANGAAIAKYLKEHKDGPKYIVLGYSKGSPDVYYGLATDTEAAANVAAFVSVAGAIGGSPIADLLPEIANKYMDAFQFGKCEGDLAKTFQSLRRDVRQQFLSGHPAPVPTYSISAVSDKSTTSKAMLENWMMLSAYDTKEDSQLLRDDTLVPGSAYLGTARADHFAIALPFDKLSNARIRSLVDKNRFPRTALLESILRFVSADLAK